MPKSTIKPAEIPTGFYRADISIRYHLSSQVLSIITRSRIVRHCHAAPSVELPACVAVKYLTLRICGYMDAQSASCGRKNPLPFPHSLSSELPPCPPRERGDSQEGGNRRCLPSCAPARRQRNSPAEVQQKRLPPGQGEPPARFKYPAGSVQKRSRPSGANTLTQFVCPAESVLRKKENPLTKVL